MSIEYLLGLFVVITFPLVAALYSLVRQQAHTMEQRMLKKFDALDVKILDLERNLRHRVSELNTILIKDMQEDKRADVNRLLEGVETLYKLLERRGIRALEDYDY